ncbi:MAG: O-antigen ligase family protein [Bacteroidetes bacterium]|nr:O-antigen ligase family protein [Bacteroidota bacterium]
MKDLLHIKENATDTISYYLLAAFVITLPFDFFYSEAILFCFALHTIIHSNANRYKNIFRLPVLLLTAVFFLNLTGMLYSPNMHEAVNIATRQLAILLFPVLFAVNAINLKKYAANLVCFLGCSCTFAILYLYGSAIATIAQTHQPITVLFSAAFMNQHFSLPLDIHATYLSLYCTFSLLAFIFFAVQEKQWQHRIMYLFCIGVLSAGMLQLSSRAVFIAFFVVINGVFPFVLFSGKKRVTAFISASLFSATCIFFIVKMDAFNERFISGLENDLSSKSQVFESVEPRWARWSAVMELVRKSPVAGYGSGAENEVLQAQFYQEKLYVAYLNELNAHSEYLSVCIRTGIAGLLVLLGVLYYGFSTAVKRKDVPFIVFMILISIVFIAENVLDTNKGIFFYSIFLSLFIIGNTRHDSKMTTA